jgi:hypothetical protein
MTTVTVSGHTFDLDPQRVEEVLRGLLPEPIQEHFVVVSGRRWPPKQVLAVVTGLDRADFTTHQARRALTRLGFTAARASHPKHRPVGPAPGMPEAADMAQTLAEAMRPFIGKWVAARDDEVLVAADSPKEVVSWLARHQQKAQSLFRVPESEQVFTGAGLA